MQRHTLGRRLDAYRRDGGNWRLKGLLLTLADGVSETAVGHAWPQTQPQGPRDYVHLGVRDADTQERALTRSEFDSLSGAVPRDEYIQRMLIEETATELDVLWREELLDTVIRGAETRKIARDATTVTEMDAKKGDLPTPGHQQFANTGSEGASAPFDEGDYSPTAYECELHEEAFAITDEQADHAQVDLIAREIERAGAAVENAINRQYLTNIIDNANQDHTVGANEVNVQDTLEAAENVTDNDFDPTDVLVMHPEFRTELADDPALASIDWDNSADQGRLGSAFGLDLFVGSGATYNGLADETLSPTNTWGWEATGEIGGVVYGQAFVHTVVYQDISVTELSAPFTDIHDLQGGVAKAWTDSVQASNDAISTITQ